MFFMYCVKQYVFILVTEVIIEFKAQNLMKAVMTFVLFIASKNPFLMSLSHIYIYYSF